jgi:transposase
MKYFAGLDVGLEETAICIIDSNGRIVRELTTFSEPEALVAALRATEVDYARVGLEACPLAPWLFEHLAAAGLPVICLEVRHLRAALAAMTHKTDRNDARGIAQILRTGWFKAVHVKSARSQERRTLLTARKTMLEQAFDVENTIRCRPGTGRRHRAAARGTCRLAHELCRAPSPGARPDPGRSGLPPAHDRPRGRRGHGAGLLQCRGYPRTVPAL